MAESLELRGKPRSVRRFNRRALIGIVGSASVIILGAAAFALRSPDRSGGSAPQELYNTTMKALPDGLTDMPASYADVKSDPPQLGPPLPGDLGAAMIGREREPVPQDNPFRYEPARRAIVAAVIKRRSHPRRRNWQTLRARQNCSLFRVRAAEMQGQRK